ncbi:MAG: hypothetical protein KDD60_07685 [Bdellovibrionales bacterium]|nr:hypothetical protein [Bdellovibrionales bacterium]
MHARELYLYILCSILLLGIISFRQSSAGQIVLPEGPSRRIAEVSRSLAERASFSPLEFSQIAEEAKLAARMAHKSFWQDAFSVGRGGDLLPKHSVFSTVFAVPFVLIFGENGFAVCQFFIVLLLLIAVYCRANQFTGKDTWVVSLWSLVLIPILGFHGYTYIFDSNVHEAALVAMSLAMMQSFPVASGSLLGLTLFVRPSNVLWIIVVSVAATVRKSAVYDVRKFFLGLGVALLLYSVVMFLWYGQPFTSPYGHLPIINENGQLQNFSHPIGFDFRIFVSQWGDKLFSFEQGILGTAPILFFLPITLVADFMRAKKKLSEDVVIQAGLMFFLGFIFSYPHWSSTKGGNRFLIAPAVIYFPYFVRYLYCSLKGSAK